MDKNIVNKVIVDEEDNDDDILDREKSVIRKPSTVVEFLPSPEASISGSLKPQRSKVDKTGIYLVIEAVHKAPSSVLFQISDEDMAHHKNGKWRKRLLKMLHKGPPMTSQELEYSCKIVYNLCLRRIKDLHELHLKREEALRVLKDITARAKLHDISTTTVVHLVWSLMSCIHHFQLRFRRGTSLFVTLTRRKLAHDCIRTYNDLISMLPKPMYRVVLNALLVFYKEGRLWTIEFCLTDLICNLLYLYDDIEEALEDIIVTAEHASLVRDLDSRMLIKVLYEILKQIKWTHMTERMMMRFLVMLRKSVKQEAHYLYNYGPMRRGVNLCLRNITQNLCSKDLLSLVSKQEQRKYLLHLIIITKQFIKMEMEEEILLEFGNIVEYAAKKYQTHRFQASFPDELMSNLFIMLASEVELLNLFGARVLENLMDRHRNRILFESPRIFYKDVSYNISVAKFSTKDKAFFKKNRNMFHLVLLATLRNHFNHRVNLENVFSLLAILAVEIPCAYTASSIVCFAMAMQEFALNLDNSYDNEASHHVHAIAMGLMCLVSYVHNAEVFYSYLTTIIDRRSEIAPHLNPPLKATYSYAQHHILWDKPELFFEDWEARYGLWKCFRNSRKRQKVGRKKRKTQKR